MEHRDYMMRCLELARLGQGSVEPNPMVGCVIVHKGKIIGEGYHQKFGEAHAEINAINSVEDKSVFRDSILYVNLEPCSHYGKTPPCAERIIREGFRKVVVGSKDPNPKVAGRGIEMLRDSDIEVRTGVLEKESEELNKRFYVFHRYKRPYVILKWAETEDGFIGVRAENTKSVPISGDLAKVMVHKWRAEEPAILVGHNTALFDDPQLNVREWSGRDPLRVVVDKNAELPAHLKLFNSSQPTIVVNTVKSEEKGNTRFIKVSNIDPDSIVEALYREDILSVLIEGGAATLKAFIDKEMWDEARIFKCPVVLKSGVRAPFITGNLLYSQVIGKDRLIFLRNHH